MIAPSLNELASAGGGFLIITASLVMLASSLRTMLVKDRLKDDLSDSIGGTLKILRDENTRLHTTVEELQAQVLELKTVLGEVSAKLEAAEIAASRQREQDYLARSGAIDRRSRTPTFQD